MSRKAMASGGLLGKAHRGASGPGSPRRDPCVGTAAGEVPSCAPRPAQPRPHQGSTARGSRGPRPPCAAATGTDAVARKDPATRLVSHRSRGWKAGVQGSVNPVAMAGLLLGVDAVFRGTEITTSCLLRRARTPPQGPLPAQPPLGPHTHTSGERLSVLHGRQDTGHGARPSSCPAAHLSPQRLQQPAGQERTPRSDPRGPHLSCPPPPSCPPGPHGCSSLPRRTLCLPSRSRLHRPTGAWISGRPCTASPC